MYQNEVRYVQNKRKTNDCMRQQVVEGEKGVVEKHQKGVMELKKTLEPEVVEAEAS